MSERTEHETVGSTSGDSQIEIGSPSEAPLAISISAEDDGHIGTDSGRAGKAESRAGSYEAVDTYEDEYQPYRAVSKMAVICLVLSLASITAWIVAATLFLPVAGIVFGLVALGKIRRYPNELTGRLAALIGIALSSVTLIGGGALHAYVYATEVPEGYERISFNELQPDKRRLGEVVPQRAFDLNGKQVFIKGYLYPDGQLYNIKQFVLIPDMGTCCFGGQPALTDMIEVTLKDPLRVEFARRKRKFAGTLIVDGSLKPVNKLGGVAYRLKADYVR